MDQHTDRHPHRRPAAPWPAAVHRRPPVSLADGEAGGAAGEVQQAQSHHTQAMPPWSSRCAAKWLALPRSAPYPSASWCADSPSAEWAARSHWRESPAERPAATMPSSPMSRPSGDSTPAARSSREMPPASMFPIPQISSPAGAVTVNARPAQTPSDPAGSAPAPAPGAGDRSGSSSEKKGGLSSRTPWRSAALDMASVMARKNDDPQKTACRCLKPVRRYPRRKQADQGR